MTIDLTVLASAILKSVKKYHILTQFQCLLDISNQRNEYFRFQVQLRRNRAVSIERGIFFLLPR